MNHNAFKIRGCKMDRLIVIRHKARCVLVDIQGTSLEKYIKDDLQYEYFLWHQELFPLWLSLPEASSGLSILILSEAMSKPGIAQGGPFAGRMAEQFRYAGPALERLRSEFLFPLLSRTMSILVRNGKLPPQPWALGGAPIYPEYVSPLATAQRSGDRAAILQLIGDLIPLSQLDPRALHVMNAPRAGQVIGKVLHVPMEVLNTPAEIAALEQAMSERANQAALVEQMGTAAGAAKENAQALALMRN